MATILAISSQVCYGRVGLSAYSFVLQKLGHEVICLPTINYLTHPGLGKPVGVVTNADTLADMGAELISLRLEEKIDYVISGYFNNVQQALTVKWLVTTLKTKNPLIKYCCDPVIGDEPNGQYVDDAVANFIKTILVPMADMVSPNTFEANYLGSLKNHQILHKSVVENGVYKNTYTSHTGIVEQEFEHVDKHLFGAGDLFTGLFIGYLLNELSPGEALEKATMFLERLAKYSFTRNCEQLPIIENQNYL